MGNYLFVLFSLFNPPFYPISNNKNKYPLIRTTLKSQFRLNFRPQQIITPSINNRQSQFKSQREHEAWIASRAD